MSLHKASAGRLALLTILIFAAFMFQPVSAAIVQTTFTTIPSYRVSGAPNYDAPGNESFWNQIGWTNISLVASVAPGGGKTPSVLVKSANDGFNVYVLLRWKDAQGPSYVGSTEAFMSNGKLVNLTYANTQTTNQLFYNSTYYYPDRAAMLWYIGNQTQRDQTAPQMLLGTNGAISAGTATGSPILPTTTRATKPIPEDIRTLRVTQSSLRTIRHLRKMTILTQRASFQ
jgi:hypothetical protein